MVLIKALIARGWTFGKAVASHTLETPRVASDIDLVERKPYLQCLLFLSDMFDKGMTGLSSTQAPKYYSAVLKAASPGDVAVGHDQKYYEAILKGQSQPMADLDNGQSDVVVMQGRRSAMPQSGDEQPDMEFDAEPWQAVSAMPLRGSVHAIADHEHPAADSIIGQGQRHRHELDQLLHSVPGLTFRLDEHLEPNQPGHYRRYVVRCPLAGCRHKMEDLGRTCKKTRNIGPSQTSLGPKEPLAYLAVWANHAEQHKSADEHIKWRPSSAQVREYMLAAGWLIA